MVAIFLLLSALTNSPALAEDKDTAVLVRLDVTEPTSGEQLAIEYTDATNVLQLEMAEAYAKLAASGDDRTVILAISEHSEIPKSLPDSALEIADRIADSNSTILIGEIPDSSDLNHQVSRNKSRRILNTVLTITRFIGIATGITTVITIQKRVPLFDALPIGLLAAAMSGTLQAINEPFQGWLVSRGMFKVEKPEAVDYSGPAPKRATLVKLFLATVAYLGILKAGLYTFGLEGESPFENPSALKHLFFDLFSAGAFGAAIEFYWDRFISESRSLNIHQDPKNKLKYQMIADTQAASISVLSTAAQVLTLVKGLTFAGFSVGKISATALTLAGIGAYAWKHLEFKPTFNKIKSRGQQLFKSCAALLGSIRGPSS